MANGLTATYDTRRAAELAVEQLVQEHKIDRATISVRAAGHSNSVGTVPSGADLKPDQSGDGEPKLDGKIEVAVTGSSAPEDVVRDVFEKTGGTAVRGL